MQLFGFQIEAADTIASRYIEFAQDRNRPFETRDLPVPFYQALSAITGAGKTPILADAVQQIRLSLSVEPIVLWLSKAKVIIDQTYTNFSNGGKYTYLIDDFMVVYLSDLNPEVLLDSNKPIIAIATVGTFNQKEKGEGTLRVYKIHQDISNQSIWDTLKNRYTENENRRPLIIVYDEGHNLSDQQVDLLLELEPEVILTASATLKTPGKLGWVIDRLKQAGWGDKLVTSVLSKDVVNDELVKKQVILGGYLSTMEVAINHLLDSLYKVEAKAQELGIPVNPKAIYVSRTNIEEDSGKKDDPKKPFHERKAPPILIWRYLVDEKRINPNEIAVYCDLAVDKNFPLPEEFNLFNNGEDDYNEFKEGNFKHIIFNQSLQEGWDDPECYFAYIDKSMGSNLQVEQVIGRVLRQPGVKHYPYPDLNTAHFYIRCDEGTVFPEILDYVSKKLSADSPEIILTSYSSDNEFNKIVLEPKAEYNVPHIYIDASGAKTPLSKVVDNIHDYCQDVVNTQGGGNIDRFIQTIGTGEDAKTIESINLQNANKIRARRIISHEIQRLFPLAEALFPSEKIKFDAKIEITSKAAIALRKAAEELVDTYLEHSILMYDEYQFYTVGPNYVDYDKSIKFKNSLHERYSGLNKQELEFAKSLDETGYPWVRNPSNGGYSIPLLIKGKGSKKFYPDFLVWKDNTVFALDPKGKHLIKEAVAVKLLDLNGTSNNQKVAFRFITEGKWDKEIRMIDNTGYSVWKLKHGIPSPVYCNSVEDAVTEALKI